MSTNGQFYSEDILNTFFIESRENLQELESSLLEIEDEGFNQELVDAIFRSIHTIKGSSGMFAIKPVEEFTHVVENLIDNVRKREVEIDSKMISLLLFCKDHIENLIDAAENPGEVSNKDEIEKKNSDLLNKLNRYLKTDEKEKSDSELDGSGEIESEDQTPSEDSVLNTCWHISLRFGKDVFRNGLDPLSFVNFLNKKGEIVNISNISDNLPSLKNANPESCYLGFEIDFKGETTKKDLEDVFEFVKDECTIRILPPRSSINDYIGLINELPEKNILIGELLNKIGTLTEYELNIILNKQMELKTEKGPDSVNLIGEILTNEKMVHKPVLDAALEKQALIKKSTTSMRIDAEKLDILINLVGELVITGANIKQISESETTDRSVFKQSVSVMTRLIEDIRDSTMSIRMVQIGETFKRFERIVRDLSRETEKDVNLVITGGDTELDKSLIEKISDPLMHLVRNAVDHGINCPEDREKKGKPRKGTIMLNAYHEAGNIVIEIKDDGCGLDREKIYNKAVETGLIESGHQISDNELFEFIFNPGFSTAKVVTNISGRGVGMDVVKKNIESLRGTIILESIDGEGTSVKIHLPLTLSIIDGFMFKVGESNYVVPLDIVIECVEVTLSDLKSRDGGNYINLRGEVLPFLRLREFYREEGEEPDIANIIVVRYKGGKAGLVVDALIGELQTVIKPLGDIFSEVKWISGSTILGSGEVAIILDAPNLIENIKNIESKVSNTHEEMLT